MLEVKLLQYYELPEEDKEWQPNNGNGKEYANYIVLFHNDKIVDIMSDAVEPEDATFSRDFNEVTSAIRKAYELGLEDGQNKG